MLLFLNKIEQNVHFPFPLGFFVTLYFPSKRALSSQVGAGHLVPSDFMVVLPSLRSLGPGSFAEEPPLGTLWSACWSLTREAVLYNTVSLSLCVLAEVGVTTTSHSH